MEPDYKARMNFGYDYGYAQQPVVFSEGVLTPWEELVNSPFFEGLLIMLGGLTGTAIFVGLIAAAFLLL